MLAVGLKLDEDLICSVLEEGRLVEVCLIPASCQRGTAVVWEVDGE